MAVDEPTFSPLPVHAREVVTSVLMGMTCRSLS